MKERIQILLTYFGIDMSTWDEQLISSMEKRMNKEKSIVFEERRIKLIEPQGELAQLWESINSNSSFTYQHKQGRLAKHIRSIERQYSKSKRENKAELYRSIGTLPNDSNLRVIAQIDED